MALLFHMHCRRNPAIALMPPHQRFIIKNRTFVRLPESPSPAIHFMGHRPSSPGTSKGYLRTDHGKNIQARAAQSSCRHCGQSGCARREDLPRPDVGHFGLWSAVLLGEAVLAWNTRQGRLYPEKTTSAKSQTEGRVHRKSYPM